MAKKKWGDRPDGVWLKELPAMNQIMTTLMPNRADNEAFVSVDIDMAPLEAYLEKKNEGLDKSHRYTFFHLISAAIGKAFILRPRMNRFVCNHRIYQRNKVTVAFTVKKQFNDHAEEGLALFEYAPEDTIDTYHEKIMKAIHVARHETDTSTGAMDAIMKLPHFMVVGIVKFVLWLDKHGWAPQFLVGTDPNHASVFLSNLGSIGLECGYHHLVNWGTNSCFVVLGKKCWKTEHGPDGQERCREVVSIGITLDERIADGYYYSGTVALVRELLAHPELLELPANSPVEFAIKK